MNGINELIIMVQRCDQSSIDCHSPEYFSECAFQDQKKFILDFGRVYSKMFYTGIKDLLKARGGSCHSCHDWFYFTLEIKFPLIGTSNTHSSGFKTPWEAFQKYTLNGTNAIICQTNRLGKIKWWDDDLLI